MKKNTKKTPNKTKKPIDLTSSVITTPLIDRSFNKVKARTPNQAKYIQLVESNTIVFCQGLAGSGKTHIAIGLAIQYLLNDRIKKIIITRPVIEAGEKIGYLPGTAEDKLHPYLLPILDEINYFIPMSVYTGLKNANKIEVVPLGLMRGRNFHDSFIVADECQNASYEQLKMLITRIGNNSKMVLTGDSKQSDLHRSLRHGFTSMTHATSGIEGVAYTELMSEDVIRNPIIAKILQNLEEYEKTNTHLT